VQILAESINALVVAAVHQFRDASRASPSRSTS
jgi:hypothetical protein